MEGHATLYGYLDSRVCPEIDAHSYHESWQSWHGVVSRSVPYKARHIPGGGSCSASKLVICRGCKINVWGTHHGSPRVPGNDALRRRDDGSTGKLVKDPRVDH